MKYLSPYTPVKYKCGKCGAFGVKLWRDMTFFASSVDLRCASCLDQGEVDAQGYFNGKYGKTDQCDTDELGSMLPAVPTEDEESYWGYSSVPQAGVLWWRNLPNQRS